MKCITNVSGDMAES